MLKFLGAFWRRTPAKLRRLTIRLTNTHFTVTVAGIVFNENGEVLLLKHLFRPGSGWGVPGGFLEANEQPDEALRRELREEISLEVDRLKIFTARSFRKARQVEIVYLCEATKEVRPRGVEIERAAWFSTTSLPVGVPPDQKRLIDRAAAGWSKNRD